MTSLTITDRERSQAAELMGALGDEQMSALTTAHVTAPLPEDLGRLIHRVMTIIANGGTVSIASIPNELTTTAAADLLGISRKTLMKKVDAGEIPSHMVGTHHRFWRSDIAQFHRQRLEEQSQALADLMALEDELGLGLDD